MLAADSCRGDKPQRVWRDEGAFMRAAPGKSGLHARGEGERVLALESWYRRTVPEAAKEDTTGGRGSRLLFSASGPSLARPRSSVTASRVPGPSNPCNAGRVSSTRGPGTGRVSPRLTSNGPTLGPSPGPDEVPSSAQPSDGGRRTGRARTHAPEPRARSCSSARLTSSCGGPGCGMEHGLSCPAECGIFLDQGLDPCPLHWQADS